MGCYKTILAATDFSASSEQAVRKARLLAEECGAELHLLHVVEHFPEDMPCDLVAPEDTDPEAFVRATFEKRLAEFAERMALAPVSVRVALGTGSAKQEIVDIAMALDADLIVLGSHGRLGASAWLGSTTDGVAHRAHCDLLTVRAAAD